MNLNIDESVKKWTRVPGTQIYLSSAVELSTRLYRYFSWDANGMLVFKKSELWFSSPTKWTDPYEQWWCDQLFKDGSKLNDAHAYASCWTTAYSHEPFWRLYDERGKVPVVRIATTVQKLVQILDREVGEGDGRGYLGKVKYRPATVLTELAEALEAEGKQKQLLISVANALIYKRLAFRTEREYRAMVVDRKGITNGRALRFDMTEALTQVMIGPLKDRKIAKEIIRTLVGQGVPKTIIKRSMLYDAVEPKI